MGSSVKYNPYGPLDEECKSDFAQSTPPTSPTTPPTSQSNGVNFGQQFEQAEQPKAEQEKAHQHAVHMLPDNIVTSAVHVASSAINTARSVLNMIKPQKPEEVGFRL